MKFTLASLLFAVAALMTADLVSAGKRPRGDEVNGNDTKKKTKKTRPIQGSQTVVFTYKAAGSLTFELGKGEYETDQDVNSKFEKFGEVMKNVVTTASNKLGLGCSVKADNRKMIVCQKDRNPKLTYILVSCRVQEGACGVQFL